MLSVATSFVRQVEAGCEKGVHEGAFNIECGGFSCETMPDNQPFNVLASLPNLVDARDLSAANFGIGRGAAGFFEMIEHAFVSVRHLPTTLPDVERRVVLGIAEQVDVVSELGRDEVVKFRVDVPRWEMGHCWVGHKVAKEQYHIDRLT